MIWQPIATAPKDGTPILVLCAAEDEPAVVEWEPFSGAWRHAPAYIDGALLLPRVWMPIPVAPPWQPIATAPKDGTPVFVHQRDRWHVPMVAFYVPNGRSQVSGRWMLVGVGRCADELTHWMPIPPLPEATS